MACFHPLRAWADLGHGGRFVFNQSPKLDLGPELAVPCGQCSGCRVDQALAAIHRVEHEVLVCNAEARAAGRDDYANCFVTLTFDDEHFPSSQADLERAVLLFVKRLRRATGWPVKTYGCLELGEVTKRPHAHLIVLGRTFSKEVPVARGEAGSVVYSCAELSALWPLGHASFGDVTTASIGYVARYTMKKRSTRDARGETDLVVHPVSGELIAFRPAMSFCVSRGLGLRWLERYGRQAVRDGYLTGLSGVKSPLPAYYKRKGREWWPYVGADAECRALERAVLTAGDRTPERLAVREVVAEASRRHLKRGAV